MRVGAHRDRKRSRRRRAAFFRHPGSRFRGYPGSQETQASAFVRVPDTAQAPFRDDCGRFAGADFRIRQNRRILSLRSVCLGRATWTARGVLRGGSWNNNPRNLRAACRNNNNPQNRNNNRGFRVALGWQYDLRQNFQGHGSGERALFRPGPLMTIMAGASGLRPIPLRSLLWLSGGRGHSLSGRRPACGAPGVIARRL
jgi:hypothetical protein